MSLNADKPYDYLLFYLPPVNEWLVFPTAKSYLAPHFMKSKRKSYSVYKKASTIFMMMALLWLTISLPFVIAGQQEMAKQQHTENTASPHTGNEEESANPFGNGNSTEEKAPGNSSFSEEYLHDHHKDDGFSAASKQYGGSDDARDYIAFHGELLVPPPNAA